MNTLKRSWEKNDIYFGKDHKLLNELKRESPNDTMHIVTKLTQKNCPYADN